MYHISCLNQKLFRDISFLLNQVNNGLTAPIPQEIKDAGNDLNQYATATRYPAEEEISQSEADRAIEAATLIIQWAETESESVLGGTGFAE